MPRLQVPRLFVHSADLSTTVSLENYRAALSEQHAGTNAGCRALWICASRHRVERVRAALMENSPAGALLAPGVTTFASLADTLLTQADRRIHPLGSLERRWILGEIAQGLLAEKKLSYFEPIAASGGFAIQLEALITDLKRRDIWPEQFSQAARSTKQRELALVYDRYQRYLIAHELYDAEGRFWAAREALAADPRLFADLQIVYVDGFTDFSVAQYDILKLLAARCERMHVHLPLENSDVPRVELFAKTTRTRQILTRLIRQPEALALEEPPAVWPARNHLESQLFGHYGATEPPSPAASQTVGQIEIVAASSEQQEAEAIAARIKRQLAEGVAPEEIVVAFRCLPEQADRLRSVFADFAIPANIDAPRPLSSSPVVRRLTLLLRLVTQDWAFRDLLRLVGDAGMNLSADAQQKKFPTARRSLERLIRSAQVPRGRRELLDQLTAWAKSEAERAAATGEATDAALTTALTSLTHLAETLDKLPAEVTPVEWIAEGEALLSALAALPAEDDPLLADWDSLSEGLHHIAKCWARFEKDTAWTRQDFLSTVEYVARHSERRERQNPSRGVLVTSVENVRYLEPGHLYLGGMGERAFPAPGRTDQLLSDAELEKFAQPLINTSQTKPSPADIDHHLADEMLLFYQVITRPSKSLTISYPALDDKAQPLEPSPYLADLRRAFGDVAIPTTVLPLGEAALTLQSEEASSQSERRRQAVAAALEDKCKPLVQLASSGAESPARSMLAALELIHSRAQREQFGPWEGIYSSNAARQRFTQAFGPQHFWSPSQLEGYAACGFRFVSESVLKLEPLPELTLEIDVRRRGSLLHEALAAVHEQLLDASDESTKSEIVDRFLDMLETLSATQGVYGLVAALKEIQRRELARWGENLADQTDHYQRMWHDFEEPPRPAHFEVRFGPGSRNAEGHESALSTNEPFSLDVPLPSGEVETVCFTGQIDRLDIGRIDATTVFNVIDYKSNAKQTVKLEKLEAGTQLQLPLYALAAEDLLMREQQGLAWEAGYWRVQGDGFGKSQKNGKHKTQLKLRESVDGRPTITAEWENAKAILLERIGELISGIRRAEFPVYNADDKCTQFCDLSTICRIGQIRSLDKKWPPPPEVDSEDSPEESAS